MSNLKKVVIPALSLFVICLVSALLLALTDDLTKDTIAASEKKAEVEQRSVVFEKASSYNEKENYVECISSDGRLIGYIFKTVGKGYGGDITVMTGIDLDGVITGVRVTNHSETSSYGGKAVKNDFTDEYTGKKAEKFILHKNIDGWTGATRTTDGVIDAVNKAVEEYAKLRGGS